MDKADTLQPFTAKDRRLFLRGKKGGLLRPYLLEIRDFGDRLRGHYSRRDQMRMACSCDADPFFLQYGIMMPHLYGITLSADSVGADCCIGQNVTIGTNNRRRRPGEHTPGFRPRLGNLVFIYAGAIISGEIAIGDCSIIAAGSIVTKDVPPKSIVYGRNEIRPLSSHHYNSLAMVLFHCYRIYELLPGLVCRGRVMYIDTDYRSKRLKLVQAMDTGEFPETVEGLF